jgi:hypothetical protein
MVSIERVQDLPQHGLRIAYQPHFGRHVATHLIGIGVDVNDRRWQWQLPLERVGGAEACTHAQ